MAVAGIGPFNGPCQAAFWQPLSCYASPPWRALRVLRPRKRASGPDRQKKSFSVLCFAETEAADRAWPTRLNYGARRPRVRWRRQTRQRPWMACWPKGFLEGGLPNRRCARAAGKSTAAPRTNDNSDASRGQRGMRPHRPHPRDFRRGNADYAARAPDFLAVQVAI